ncbi:peptidase M24 [Serratia sp. AS12]|uniref:M24 family metallopeptidase n=1 Tax=Serratia TaxID=613 RepID=UPI00020E9E53|nr:MULTISPECIES: Xaa-Pro peptidase family protein [Serratia]AEF45651.1 peptidase M24 [Serratia plymuthica AS9]AEF50602.1 peptidase M24 [Serratia sp. AS12]AEG28309.1 peptidase M24 [Serratia sp. AS13]UTN99102.1 Xaa-Pro peptidase family protein [Serratia plymuthica]
MATGIGGCTPQQALEQLQPLTDNPPAIASGEYRQRIQHAQRLMRENDIDACYINAGNNLLYFTGTSWSPSERMVGAVIPAEGEIAYIAPWFEIGTFKDAQVIEAEIFSWHEEEDPYQLFFTLLASRGLTGAGRRRKVAICETASVTLFLGLQQYAGDIELIGAQAVTGYCRGRKSPTEIALMQTANNITLRVQQAAASILYPGITTSELIDFVDKAHRKMGTTGSYFCIALFGSDSAFPHGVKEPKPLRDNDIVLLDTGCRYKGYLSDITRTYVYGEPSARQRFAWQAEHEAQAAAFSVIAPGVPCHKVDDAARQVLASYGFGPDYQLPGLPHRTGHGIGLDIHEAPYLVRKRQEQLDVGMCASIEPMLCLPGEFGIRLEDHFYVTEGGAHWFTPPAKSLDDPFDLAS